MTTPSETPFDLPLDLDHVPADLPEAIEMLKRALRRLREAEEQRDDYAQRYDRLVIERDHPAERGKGMVLVPSREFGLLATWWAMVNAGRELDGDPALKDDQVILNYSGNGAGCFLTTGDLNRLFSAAEESHE